MDEKIKELIKKKDKTEFEVIAIINEYEIQQDNQNISGTTTLVKFIQWYDKQ